MRQPLLLPVYPGHWRPARDGDPQIARMYQRHYSCYRYADDRRQSPGYRNRNLVMGPGEKMILVTEGYTAIFGWRKFIDASGQQGVNCAFFRNESSVLSSALILEAEEWAQRRWSGERMYTYVDASAVQSANPGYCFRRAGWRRCGTTKARGLLIFEKE